MMMIIVNVLVNNDERTIVTEARQRYTSGCHPSSFFHRANAFPSTTSTSAKSRRLV